MSRNSNNAANDAGTLGVKSKLSLQSKDIDYAQALFEFRAGDEDDALKSKPTTAHANLPQNLKRENHEARCFTRNELDVLREFLSQFPTSDPEDAISKLETCNWNVTSREGKSLNINNNNKSTDDWIPGIVAQWTRAQPFIVQPDPTTEMINKVALRLSGIAASGEKELCLIVGRTNKESHPPLPDCVRSKKAEWVFGNIVPTPLDYPLQLTMDFSDHDLLRILESNMFYNIVFDWSVWKYVDHRERVLLELLRLLTPGGYLYFDDIIGAKNLQFRLQTEDYMIEPSIGLPRRIFLRQNGPESLSNEEVMKHARAEFNRRVRVFCIVLGFDECSFIFDDQYPIRNSILEDSSGRRVPIGYFKVKKGAVVA